MKNHLYISDLDKTLLNDNAELSTYAKEELNKMIADGLHFTIATARSHISAQYILQGLNLQLPVIVANGSFLSEFNSGKIIYMQEINEGIKKSVLETIINENIYPFVSAANKRELKLFYQEINNPGLEWYLQDLINADDPRREKIENLKEALAWDIVSYTVIEKEDIVRKLGDLLHGKFPNQLDIHYYENPYDEGWFWMSIHDITATKGNMVKKYIDHSKYSMNKVSVFGDNVNDIPMFEITKNGFAVSNAADVLKEKAVKIIGSNMENGVVEYIKSEFYNEL